MTIFKKKGVVFCHSWLKSLSPNLFRGEIWYKNTLIYRCGVFFLFVCFVVVVLFCFVFVFCMKRQNVFRDQFYE